MSRIFIDRPIFAWVLAIVVMLAGLGAIFTLPLEQYPDVAPPVVNIRATYPGASAETVENSVTQIIEQQLTGIDGLLYFASTSSSRGSVSISATFAKGTDPDIAQVQVQNQVQQALPRLPQPVQQQGVRVTKSNPDFLLIVAVYDSTDPRTNRDVSDYLAALSRIHFARAGGGEVKFRAPHRCALAQPRTARGVRANAERRRHGDPDQIPSRRGRVAASAKPEQMLAATVTAQSPCRRPPSSNSHPQTEPTARPCHEGRRARRARSDNYNAIPRQSPPGAGIAVSLAPGADALARPNCSRQGCHLSRNFPEGLVYAYANDTTDFIKLSVSEVTKTLIEAVILVVLVIFVFLQNWRAMLIPAIAIPVVLLGTFAIFYIAGFTINTLTLFGLTLAVGLLVDDAIVVVENVERLLDEKSRHDPRDATIQSMSEIQVALVAIALSLSAVFLPMAFFGGSTGVIYKQFSLTIVSAMVLSVLVALILSPALTSTLLRRRCMASPARHARPALSGDRPAGPARAGLVQSNFAS